MQLGIGGLPLKLAWRRVTEGEQAATPAASAAAQAPVLQQGSRAQPGSPAQPAAAASAAPRQVAQLRRFAACCAALFGRPAVPAERLTSASFADLAAALLEQLGAAALGDLTDGRDEWERLADLLSYATATAFSVHSVEADLFVLPCPGTRIKPGRPGGPNFLRMHELVVYADHTRGAWGCLLRGSA